MGKATTNTLWGSREKTSTFDFFQVLIKLIHDEEESINVKIISNENINILDLLIETNLSSSKSSSKRIVEQNGISINKVKENNINRIIKQIDFINGCIIIQKGKKVFLKVKIEV